jgi:hypothetical protein
VWKPIRGPLPPRRECATAGHPGPGVRYASGPARVAAACSAYPDMRERPRSFRAYECGARQVCARSVAAAAIDGVPGELVQARLAPSYEPIRAAIGSASWPVRSTRRRHAAADLVHDPDHHGARALRSRAAAASWPGSRPFRSDIQPPRLGSLDCEQFPSFRI